MPPNDGTLITWALTLLAITIVGHYALFGGLQ